MTNNTNPLALSSLSDEELLLRCYGAKPLLTPMEQELALRLEHALDALQDGPTGIGDVLTATLIKTERSGGSDA